MSSRIVTYSGVLGAIAECRDCGWRSETRQNALANAKRHAMAYGHTVTTEQTIGVTYTPDGSAYMIERDSRPTRR